MARTIDSLMVMLLLLSLWCCELATKTSAWTIQPQPLFESSFRTKKQNPLFSDSSSSSTTSCPSSFDNNSNTVDNRHNKSTDGFDFTIRQCEYAELSAVADIIMDSFYDTKTSWKKLYQLGELNRLQQNFPYVDADLHQMLVATTVDKDDDRGVLLVGFCDVDARDCKTRPVLPRPYVSDICVHPDYRRKGIAQALIQESERFLQKIPRSNVYIRVEESNHAAIAMYEKLRYTKTGREEADPSKKDSKTILVLQKEFH